MEISVLEVAFTFSIFIIEINTLVVFQWEICALK